MSAPTYGSWALITYGALVKAAAGAARPAGQKHCQFTSATVRESVNYSPNHFPYPNKLLIL
jgi:hypothetical protein